MLPKIVRIVKKVLPKAKALMGVELDGAEGSREGLYTGYRVPPLGLNGCVATLAISLWVASSQIGPRLSEPRTCPRRVRWAMFCGGSNSWYVPVRPRKNAWSLFRPQPVAKSKQPNAIVGHGPLIAVYSESSDLGVTA